VDCFFSLQFGFPLHFTSGVWDTGNPLFADTLRRLEPERQHRVLLVIDDKVAAATANLFEDIEAYFTAHSSSIVLAAPPVVVGGGEDAKNDITHALELIGRINRAGLDRQSFVAILGGGAVLDMASFAAAIAHRGIRAVRLPTTVLSQADSGIGVKNGINLFGKKNFAGTFAPPFAVINDIRFLETLARRDRISGVSEAIKVALLKDPDLFDHIEAHAAGVAAGKIDAMQVLIRRSAELHVAHICGSGDPFELGSARPLDFGHWAAHKLESITSHNVKHGEAVAMGMALDVIYSVRRGFLERAVADRILDLIRATGFALWNAAMMEKDAAGQYRLLSGLREFREHLGGELHITLLRGIGASFEVTEMDEATVMDSLHELEVVGRTPLEPMAR
jgi:3-dehydroquinate synthase